MDMGYGRLNPPDWEMNIDEMGDQEKSRKLVVIAGLGFGGPDTIYIKDPLWLELGMRNNMIKSLYDPANMALAWRVLNWANGNWGIRGKLEDWFVGKVEFAFLDESPADAQRLWLDKILTLVEVTDA